MRLFIALKTTSFEDELYRVIEEIKPFLKGVKIVERENLHITIKFLGETEQSKVPLIEGSLALASEKFSKFSFLIKGISGFPKEEKANVIFFDIVKGREAMILLAEFIEKEISKLGFPKEHSFVPHLTFGRAKFEPQNLKIISVKDFSINAEVLGLSLISSTLTPKGPIYNTLSDFEFRK